MKKFRIYIIIILAAIAVLYSSGVIVNPFDFSGFVDSKFVGWQKYLMNGLALALLAVVLRFAVLTGRIKFGTVLKNSGSLALSCVGIAVCGTIIAWAISKTSFFGGLFSALFAVLIAALFVLHYASRRKKYSKQIASNSVRRSAVSSGQVKYSFATLYSTLILFAVFSIVVLIVFGKNNAMLTAFFIPLLIILLWRLTKWRGWFAVGFVTMLLHSFSMVKLLVTGYFSTFNPTDYSCFIEFGAISALILTYCSLLVSMADIYSFKNEIN